jgi:hypothetical protein
MIPENFKDENHRMMWEFVWDNDGVIRPDAAAIIGEIENLNDLHTILRRLFPYSIEPSFSLEDFAEGGCASEEVHGWLRENLQGAWQLWHVHGKGMQFPLIMFENVADALFFKLRWS